MVFTTDIISKLKTGDRRPFTDLFDRYWEKLIAAAFHRLKDEELAKDVVQEVFIHLWDNKAHLNLTPANIEFYLLRAVKNKVIDYIRAEKVQQSAIEELMHRMQKAYDGNLDVRVYEELEDFLDQEINTLPLTMRSVFLMRNNNTSIAEIAHQLNIKEQTVKNYLSEASQKIKIALQKRFQNETLTMLFAIASYLHHS